MKRPKVIWVEDEDTLYQEGHTARELIDPGYNVIDTGLLDQYGKPILKYPTKVPFGFVGKHGR